MIHESFIINDSLHKFYAMQGAKGIMCNKSGMQKIKMPSLTIQTQCWMLPHLRKQFKFQS